MLTSEMIEELYERSCEDPDLFTAREMSFIEDMKFLEEEPSFKQIEFLKSLYSKMIGDD